MLLKFIHPSLRQEFCSLFDVKFLTKGRSYCRDGKLKYHVNYGLTSGDMDTAIIGCLVMSGMLYCYLEMLRQIRPSFRYSVIDMGDDSSVIVEACDYDFFVSGLVWFEQMGFNIVAEKPVYEMEHISFCQMRPIITEEGVSMVRQFPNCWSKDVVSLVPINHPRVFRRWCTAVGLAGSSWMGNVPIMGRFFENLIFNELPIDHPTLPRGLLLWGKGMDVRGRVVDPVTRASFYVAFGISPDEQRAIESNLVKPSFSEPIARWYDIGKVDYSYY